MLYIHYQNTSIDVQIASITGIKTTKELQLTLIVFSSSKSMVQIYGKGDYAAMVSFKTLLTQIAASRRSYDPNTHIWTIPTEVFNAIFKLKFPPHLLLEHDDINAWATPDDGYNEEKKVPQNAEDFFYNTSQPTTSNAQLSLESLTDTLTGIFREIGITDADIAVAYKKAARKLHPDLGGSAEKMSELNMIWQQYKQLKGA
jgi:hypothetical protein